MTPGQGSDSGAAPRDDETAPEGAPPAQAAVRVLIVDDNAMNLELAAFILDAAGMHVATALDAVHAQALVKSFAPALILMDIQMPGMDGLSLTRLLKADTATRHIVIVAFTAFAMKGDEEKARAAGCDGYLTKPIDTARLAAQVRSCLPAAPAGGSGVGVGTGDATGASRADSP